MQLSQRGFWKLNNAITQGISAISLSKISYSSAAAHLPPGPSPTYLHSGTTTSSTLAIQTMPHSENIHIQCARSFPTTCLSNSHTVIFTAATSYCPPLERLPALSQSSTGVSLAGCREFGSYVRPCGLRGQVRNGDRSIYRWSWKSTTCTTSGTILC